MEDKKILIVGAGEGKTSLAQQIASHASLSNVIICDAKPKEIMEEQNMNELLAATMIASYAPKLKKKGSNVTPKKKKRKKKKRS